MDEYVKRDDALKIMRDTWMLRQGDDAMQESIDLICKLHAADVQPVVRGRWKDAMQSCHDSPHVKCSVCSEYYWQYFKKFSFCPNCGADMRGEKDV